MKTLITLVPKLRLGTSLLETRFRAHTPTRNRVSQTGVPKRSLGTRDRSERTLRFFVLFVPFVVALVAFPEILHEPAMGLFGQQRENLVGETPNPAVAAVVGLPIRDYAQLGLGTLECPLANAGG